MNRIIITVRDEVGVIADISKALADESINIEAINTEVAGEKGVVILTTNEPDRALRVLMNAGFRAISDEATVIRLRDEPGALAKVAEKFKVAGVNIQSMHILGRQDGYAMIGLTTDDTAEARRSIGDEFVV